MKRKILLTFLIFPFLFSGCSGLQQVATQAGTQILTGAASGVGNTENAAGLKDALSVGIANAVTALSKENGYYSNPALRILLPKEAQPILDNIKLIPGGQNLVNDVELRLNRAAEDAAKEATPIFLTAIKSMTIADAANILFGNSDAATQYLKKTTYSQLTSAFAPKINTSLDKKLVGNISTNQSWSTLTSTYDSVANSLVGKTAKLTPVNTDLGSYVTGKALDGLFSNLAGEELKIRQNPAARVNDLLKKVFGQLDKK
ncbi:MAG: DUF4197 domain-containing protein [Candidatus Azobacteroides sp.]|nr:DUF4197 domain-containing protein [Candidatus Azobacteroides sp.]